MHDEEVLDNLLCISVVDLHTSRSNFLVGVTFLKNTPRFFGGSDKKLRGFLMGVTFLKKQLRGFLVGALMGAPMAVTPGHQTKN